MLDSYIIFFNPKNFYFYVLNSVGIIVNLRVFFQPYVMFLYHILQSQKVRFFCFKKPPPKCKISLLFSSYAMFLYHILQSQKLRFFCSKKPPPKCKIPPFCNLLYRHIFYKTAVFLQYQKPLFFCFKYDIRI